MILWHWLAGPIHGADALLGLVAFSWWQHVSTRRLVLAEWKHAKARLGAEVEQLKQRRNLAEIAARQAEERARG